MSGTLKSALPVLNPQTMMYRFPGETVEFPFEKYDQVARERLKDAIARLADVCARKIVR